MVTRGRSTMTSVDLIDLRDKNPSVNWALDQWVWSCCLLRLSNPMSSPTGMVHPGGR
jgi:hypothetical protein